MVVSSTKETGRVPSFVCVRLVNPELPLLRSGFQLPHIVSLSATVVPSGSLQLKDGSVPAVLHVFFSNQDLHTSSPGRRRDLLALLTTSIQPSLGVFEVATSNWSLEPAFSWSLFEHGLEPTSPFVENVCFSSEWSGTSSKPSATYCVVNYLSLGPTISSPSNFAKFFECI